LETLRWNFARATQSLQNQPAGVELKPATARRFIRIGFLDAKRRFTRLTHAFSNKLENLEHNVALYFIHYIIKYTMICRCLL